MEADISTNSLPIYEALASGVRLSIIHLLADKEMNIKEIAEALELSSAIMTMHIRKLEKAGIIKTKMVPGKGGTKKVCSLITKTIEISFPQKSDVQEKHYHKTVVSVGHYTDFEIKPTCGIATAQNVIGIFDEPRYFLDPERVNAGIFWFGQGFVEYKVPNYLMKDEEPTELEISMELCSEAPYANDNWPSDISFFLNGVLIGSWTSPGDFGGGKKGKYTPDWWWDEINQYGLLKVLKVNSVGTFIDGQQISNVTIDQLNVNQNLWSFRLAVLEDAKHVGGLTLFGSSFGNYNQDIVFKLYYQKSE
jgi:predicted transcriptional regulator